MPSSRRLLQFSLLGFVTGLKALSLVAAEPASAASSPSAPPASPGFFLCIGQSNMIGRAKPAANDTGEIPDVWLFDAAGRWTPARHPYNIYSTIRHKDRVDGVSPAYGFALRLRKEAPDTPVCFVVNARGWTALDEWRRGGAYYAEAVRRAKEAVASGGGLRGILWVQGETDIAAKKTDTYLDRLVAFVGELREDLGDVPFVAAEIEGQTAFNEPLRQLPARVPRTAVASADGLVRIDTYHYDVPSATLLGQRLAEAFLTLPARPLPKINP